MGASHSGNQREKPIYNIDLIKRVLDVLCEAENGNLTGSEAVKALEGSLEIIHKRYSQIMDTAPLSLILGKELKKSDRR